MTKSKEEKPYKEELDKAWKKFEENKFDEAIELANKTITKHPGVIRAIALIAHIDFEKNDYKKSVEGFEKCTHLDTEQKNLGYFYYWIGRIYDYYGFEPENELHDTEKANEYFKSALKHNNYPPDLILRVLRTKKNAASKKSIIQRGIKEFPNFITFYTKLFNTSKIEGNLSLISTLKEGYANTKSYTLGFLIGKYFEENKNYVEAISYYNEGLQLVATDSEKKYFYHSLGTTNFRNGKLKDAIEYFAKTTDFEYTSFTIVSLLEAAFTCLTDNNKEQAIHYLEKIRIDEDFFQIELADNLVWLESEYTTDKELIIDFKTFEKKLRELRNGLKGEIKDNISLILILIYRYNNKYYDRFRVTKQLVDDYSQEYLLDEYINSYSDYFDYLEETNRDIKNLYTNLINDISNSYSIKQKLVSSYTLKSIIKHLFAKEEFGKVIRIGNLLNPEEISEVDFWFELAYSFGESGDSANAQKSYKIEIEKNSKSGASYNNLSIILEKNDELVEAFKCISEARKLEPDKEIYERNFNRIKQRLNEEKIKNQEFKKSIENIENETDFAISKLSYFITNIKTDPNFKNNKLPIANWMFPKFIGANKEMAHSLKDQWLDKGYLYKTDERTDNNVVYYSLNPLIEKALERNTACKVDEKWIDGITSISKEVLEEIDYPENILKISRINKKYKEYILRDYKELTVNYLLKNEKATLILAGSLTEYLLTYYCEKKKITKITYLSPKGKSITKKLYDCVLDDLIKYFEAESLLKTEFYHLNNLSRIYRNYVHPGKELRDVDELNINKARICFIGVSELLKKII